MNTLLGFLNLSGMEIILILGLVLILFGAKKLPELAKGLGSGIKEFKKATREVTDEIQNSMDDSHSHYSSLPPPKRPAEANVQSNTAESTEPPKPAGADTPTSVPHSPEQKS